MTITKDDELKIEKAVASGIETYFKKLEETQGFTTVEHTRNHAFTMGLENDAKTFKKAGIVITTGLLLSASVTIASLLWASVGASIATYWDKIKAAIF